MRASLRPYPRATCAVLRSSIVVAALGLGASVAAQNFKVYRDSVEKGNRTFEKSRDDIENIQRRSQQTLSAQGSEQNRRASDEWLRRANGPVGSTYGGGTDNTYVPSSNATRALSRSAPAGPGGDLLREGLQAWQQGRDADALGFLRRASEAGSAIAASLLGSMHDEGIGVSKNPNLAVAFFRRAAALGDDEALLQLGRAFALGVGVPEDRRQALDWYTKASRRSTTRERGEIGVAAVRQLEELDQQLAAAERCLKTNACDETPGSPVASAGDTVAPTGWSRLSIAVAHADFYVDRSSLSRRDDRVVVSELIDFRAPQSLGSATYLSAKLRKEYDCRNGTIRTLSAEAFASAMGGGRRVMADSQPTAPQVPPTGSQGEALRNSACTGS